MSSHGEIPRPSTGSPNGSPGDSAVSRFVNSVVLGIVSFIVLLSIFWYVVEVRHENRVEITGLEARWGPVDARSTNVLWDLTFQNSHKSVAQVTRISYEFALSDYVVSEETRNLSLRLPAEGEGRATVAVAFPSSFLPAWLEAHAEQQERSTLVFRGTVSLLVNQGRVEVPFDVQRDFQTTLALNLARSLSSCPEANGTVCLSGAQSDWDTTRSVTLPTQVRLQNPGGTNVTVRDLEVALLLHGIEVARGAATTSIPLRADGEQVAEVLVRFDEGSLLRWWPRHVESCEESPVTVTAAYTVDPGDGNATAQVSREFSAPTFESRFACP